MILLRTFALQDIACEMARSSWEEILGENNYIMDLISEGGKDAEDLFRACINFRSKGKKHPGNRCNWHVHNTTEKCTVGHGEANVKN